MKTVLLIISIAASALSTSALGQIVLPASRLHPITSPVRDAGVLHLATGAWTRKSSMVNLGADVVFNNSCSTEYYSALSADTYVDEGRVPSPSSPVNINSRPGCASSYTIDGFQLQYCTDQPSPVPYAVAFYESYVSCASVIGVTPTASFALAGLPGHTGSGSGTCWTVAIDLGPALAFPMMADGDGSYSGSSNSNLFGWSMSTTAPGSRTGPVIAGEPSVCTGYDGTRWDTGPGVSWPANIAEPGTGMGALGQFRIEGGSTPPGCYYSDSPFPSFHLRLYADACPAPPGQGYCYGDGSVTACPCGNESPSGSESGCLHSGGVGGRLSVSGQASLSGDTLLLLGTSMPANVSALFIQGTARQNNGSGTVLGDGLRCAGGTVWRLSAGTTNAAGQLQYPRAGQPDVSVQGHVLAPGLRTYQLWYRNSAAFCTASTFNLTNGWDVVWGP